MTPLVTLTAELAGFYAGPLEGWGRVLDKTPTLKHHLIFESVECLKWLRELFTREPADVSGINSAPFVQPIEYRRPKICCKPEAYFANLQDARDWFLVVCLK